MTASVTRLPTCPPEGEEASDQALVRMVQAPADDAVLREYDPDRDRRAARHLADARVQAASRGTRLPARVHSRSGRWRAWLTGSRPGILPPAESRRRSRGLSRPGAHLRAAPASAS